MQNTNTELRLENVERDDHFLSIRTDISGKPDIENENLICLQIIFKDKKIELCGEDIFDDGVEYFHLDKFQTGCLIDYLSRVYASM